ncbi:MAG TPA: thioredoxin domain-containing protein [Gemmatimonadaceae bacterium]|nr:thioredoxin domain-containing protein [Gemmatimonadaceae bacterium]
MNRTLRLSVPLSRGAAVLAIGLALANADAQRSPQSAPLPPTMIPIPDGRMSGGLTSRGQWEKLVSPAWRDTLGVYIKRADSLAARAPTPLPILGAPTAPLVVELWEDYQCPFCAQQDPISKAVLQAYVDRGLVRVIVYDFPISQLHPFALDGAMFAHCVRDQGKFSQVRHALFQQQARWASGGDPRPAFREIAKQVSVDPERAIACYESGKFTDVIRFGFQEALRRCVRSTPTFYIAGDTIRGGTRTQADFQGILERALRGQRAATAAPAPGWKSALLTQTGGRQGQVC